jgi:flagellar protein FlaG
MIVNINNDDYNLGISNKPTVVEKVVSVPEVALLGGSPASGNEARSNAAKSEQNETVKEEANRVELDESVRDLNEHMQVVQRELHFSIDTDSGETVIKVMDLATQQVIRQIPNEEALRAARSLGAGFDIELLNEYT